MKGAGMVKIQNVDRRVNRCPEVVRFKKIMKVGMTFEHGAADGCARPAAPDEIRRINKWRRAIIGSDPGNLSVRRPFLGAVFDRSRSCRQEILHVAKTPLGGST